MKNIAIVTGASSGLGKEFVRLLANNQDIDEIYAISRNKDKLELLVSEFGQKISPYPADLSTTDEIKSFAKFLEDNNFNIKILINSAGFAKFCSYDEISIDETLNMIDLNINGVVTMGLVCIPFMKDGAHIINIASLAAFQPVPYQNVYSATKSFVKNYSRALNVELKEKGITVTAVCPGWLKTNLYERANIGAKKAVKNFWGIVNPDVVAKKALKDAFNRKDISVYGAYNNFIVLLSKFLPEKLIMKLWLLQQYIL